MNGPILSIITVNFNNNLGLLKTLESVSSQSFSSYEHIIIDAGSTDGSRETIIQYEKENHHKKMMPQCSPFLPYNRST